jgi:hypothetical protein
MKFILFTITTLTSLLFSSNAEEILDQKCKSCHQGYIAQKQLIQNYEQNNTIFKLKAPTLTELSFALRDQIGDRRADKESQIMEIEDFLSDYLNSPDKKKSIFKDSVIKHFDTMPRVKLSEDEIEILAPYMFDYSKEMVKRHSVARYSYMDALKKAKTEDKIVLIEGYITFCRGCIKMDREVFVEDRVKKILDRDFVFVKMNMLSEKLPFGMNSM